MITDKFGRFIFTEKDMCDLVMQDPSRKLSNLITNDNIQFNQELNLTEIPDLTIYDFIDTTVEEYDNLHSQEWFMPQEYKNFDIAKWVLDQCKTDEELQRAGEELIMFQERNMFILLQYLKYLVDIMRKHNIVWGVGRGSSIASFVLYLIGVHRINSLYYDLSITEFLK